MENLKLSKSKKRNYLLNNDGIILDRLTNHKDYLKKDIIKKIKDNNIKINKNNKKEILFLELIKLKNIIQIQKFYRRKIININIKYSGPGYININLC